MKYSKEENYDCILRKIEKKESKSIRYLASLSTLIVVSLVLVLTISYQNTKIIFQNEIIWNNNTEKFSQVYDICGEHLEKDISKEFPSIKNWVLPEDYRYISRVKLSCDGKEELPYYEILGEKSEMNTIIITISKENRGPDSYWCYGGFWESILKLSKSNIHNKEVILVKDENSLLATFEQDGYYITIEMSEYEENSFFLILESIIK